MKNKTEICKDLFDWDQGDLHVDDETPNEEADSFKRIDEETNEIAAL